MSTVTDYNGQSLSDGMRVEAWLDGVRFEATVKEIRPHAPGCADHRHVVLRRDDGTEAESFSDAVVAIGSL